MTGKEWKELCKWAKKLNCNRIEAQCNVDVEGFEDEVIYIKSVDDYLGYKIVLVIEQDGMIYSANSICVAEHRTPAQIKSIIENLL